MFLHIGNSKMIRTDSVIGIFDLDQTTVSPVTKKYLSSAQKRARVILAAEELPKSFLLTAPDPRNSPLSRKSKRFRGNLFSAEEECVYLSQLSPMTLVQRTERKN